MNSSAGGTLSVAPEVGSQTLRSVLWRSPDEVPLPDWLDCLANSDSNEPTLGPQWLRTWWDVFGSTEGRQGCLIGFYRGGCLIGLAPLLQRTYWHWNFLPLRRLEVLASGERPVEAICSDYVEIVARRGEEMPVAEALVADLLRGHLGQARWDELVIPLAKGDGPLPHCLVAAARQQGLLASVEVVTNAPYIPLPSSWNAYLQQLDRKSRYLINRSQRDFDRWADGTARLQVADSPTTLEQGQQILYRLHQERWQGQGGVFRAPRFVAFHEKVMPQLLQSGCLELLWLTVRGEPVAALYNLLWNNKISFYQCGRKLDVPKGIRPGGIILQAAIQRAIEAGRQEFDFLGGESRYKSQLALASRPIVAIRLARPSWREWSLRGLQTCKATLRPVWHRLRNRRLIQPQE